MEYKVDLHKPYVFISYSHTDKKTVHDFVKVLVEKGLNVWIDKEMHIGDKWKKRAYSAITSKECKALLFFRSLNSVKSSPILSELQKASKNHSQTPDDQKRKILIVDIEDDAPTFSQQLIDLEYDLSELKNSLSNKLHHANIDGQSKIQLNKQLTLVTEQIECIQYHSDQFDENTLTTFIKDKTSIHNLFKTLKDIGYHFEPITNEYIQSIIDHFQGKEMHFKYTIEVNEITNIEDNEETIIDALVDIEAPKFGKVNKVRIFNSIYNASTQSEAMGKIYEALLNMHPYKLEEVISKQAHVAYQADTRSQFRVQYTANVNDVQVIIGTSLGIYAKLKELEKLCKILSVPTDSISLIDENNVELTIQQQGIVTSYSKSTAPHIPATLETSIGTSSTSKAPATNIIKVRVYDELIGVKNQNDAMQVVYSKLLADHPVSLDKLNNTLSNISLEKKTNSQFRTFITVTINDQPIYVGTSLGIQEKIKHAARLCQALNIPTDAFGFIDDQQQEHYVENKQVLVRPFNDTSIVL